MTENHRVGNGHKGFILAIHLLTKTERDRIELWMDSRKLELEEEEDKILQEQPSNHKEESEPSNIETDLILIDDEDEEEIECCYDSKEQSMNELRSSLFTTTPTLTSGESDRYSDSIKVPYENKTLLTKMKPGKSILKVPQRNNDMPAESFDANVALAKMLKKINEDEKVEKDASPSVVQLEKEKTERVVDVEQHIESEEPCDSREFEKLDGENEVKAANGEMGVVGEPHGEHQEVSHDKLDGEEELKAANGEIDVVEEPHGEHQEWSKEELVGEEVEKAANGEIDVVQEPQEESHEELDGEEDAKAENDEQLEEVQARPFNSNVPSLIFSTLF